MGRGGDENEDANACASEEELLDEMFTERSDKDDDDLTISLDCSDHRIETQRPDDDLVSKDSSANSADSDVPTTDRSSSSSAVERLPVLLRATSQGAYFDEHQRSLDPDHTVGRTRVPWHSKSASDLRDPSTKPTRIVAFDVGGKLFRCKESLIAKYPLKRLNQIITCGCGKISCLDDAFFIDRNPQHFEMILDWYRTGKLVRQRNVDEEAFKDDAIYFDLYEELFPTTPAGDPPQSWPTTKPPPGLPTRRRSVNDVDLGRGNTKRVSMFASMPSPPAHQVKKAPPQKEATESPTESEDEKAEDVGLPATTDDGPLRFYRRERRVLTPTSIPLVFKIRKFEQLLVESVKGRGKLMLRVCDVTGMQAVDVPEAVLFDSHSRFYLKGERAQLQHTALLPGDHVYTFWVEESTNGASVQTSSSPALDIEFKLLFTFDPGDRITPAMESELSRATSGSHDIHALTPEGTPQPNSKTESFSPCLFLPPSQVQRAPELTSLQDESNDRVSQAKPAKKLAPLSKKNGVKRGNQHQHLSSPIRHAGAAIVRSAQQPHPRPAEGKITVYRPEKLDLDPTLLGLHRHPASSERRMINQAVESAYQDMQPRLFR